jgi:hypothetical protein
MYEYSVFGNDFLLFFIGLAVSIGMAFLGRWIASIKGHSTTGWFWICFFFTIIGLAIILLLPVENKNNFSKIKEEYKCPYFDVLDNNKKMFCKYCGKEINEIEIELKQIEEKKQQEKYSNGTIKNIEDLFKDKEIMDNAKKLRRIYGKNVYISHLKDKAKELGLGDIEINPEDVE